MEPRRDGANLYVLEAVLMAFLLLGSAYAVTTLRRSSMENVAPREGLEELGADALTVLEGIPGGKGSALETGIVQALHCARDAAPSTTDCDGRRPGNLTLRIGGYLPAGAGYALKLGNGAGSQIVYETGSPAGEASATSIAFTPDWNMTFILPELSCYPADADVNVTMIPLLRGRNGTLTALNLSYGGATQAVASKVAAGWNATVPAASRPASPTLVANATGRDATYNGSAQVAPCDLGGKESAILPALRAAAFSPATRAIALGSTATFNADITALGALSGVTRGTSEILLYDPVTPQGEADTWLLAARLPLPPGNTPTATWTPPPESLYGTHVAVLRINLTVGAQPVVAQRLALLDVALPTGQVPIDPLYRAILQTWMNDWR